MPNPNLSILVVDDAKFSSAIIGRALSQAGYQDVRFASSAAEAVEAGLARVSCFPDADTPGKRFL